MDQPNRPDRRNPEPSPRSGGAGGARRSGASRSGGAGRPDRGAGADRGGRPDRGSGSGPDRSSGRDAESGRTSRPTGDERRGARGERPFDDRADRTGPSRSDRSPSAARRPVDKRSSPPGGDRRADRDGTSRRPRGGEGRERSEPPRPGLARKANEPPIPEGVDIRILHRAARAELRGLPQELADIVASHLVVAGQLIEEDPELAYAHAEAARRRAARLPIVREAAAETAYAAGRWDVALSEFRALRRMTGAHDYLPVMADCERALGRPHNALKLAREADRLPLDPALRTEMTIVEAGARADLGQHPEARRILQRAVEDTPQSADIRLPLARLRYAYAESLLQDGDEAEARRWFVAAAKLDTEGELDAGQRVDELDGMLIEFDEDEDEDEDEEVGPGEDQAPGSDGPRTVR